MVSAFWEDVLANGLKVPTSRPLDDLTAELTTMLGSTDPQQRDALALPTLATWVEEGVYDDLLSGLGDGIAAGLSVGLGTTEADSVFRRSFSVLVLAEIIDRDTTQDLLTKEQVLVWGDRIMTWLLRERDLRGFVPVKGWAHAVAHGADALGALARSPKFGRLELTVLLDVIADRLLMEGMGYLVHGESDRLALATMHLLRRNLVSLEVLEPWVARLAAAATPAGPPDQDPFLTAGNVQDYLRALHLQLALAPAHPAIRTDLLLVLIEALRRTNAVYLGPLRTT